MSSTNRSYSDYTSAPLVELTSVEVGDAVPHLERTVGRVQLTLYTAALRFAHQVHFDDELCRRQGWKGVILPGFLLGNWCAETVTRMLGPRSVVRRIAFRMSSVAYPETTYRIQGEVTEVSRDGELVEVTCAMRVTDANDGSTVTTATVVVATPI